MTGYGGPGYPRSRQKSFEDSGSWSGFLHPPEDAPEQGPVTERIPRVQRRPPQSWRPPEPEHPAPPPAAPAPSGPPTPPGPSGPPGRSGPAGGGRRRLLVAGAVVLVLVVGLAGAATFILVNGGNGGRPQGHASTSPTPVRSPSAVPHVTAAGKPVAPAGAPYRYATPAGFVVGVCLVTQGSGAPQHSSCVQPTGATTQDMVLVMNFPITVDADELSPAAIERQLDKLYADRLHSTYQYLSIDGGRAWKTQLTGAGTAYTEVHLYKGRQHIEVLCQSTPPHQTQITKGCDAVLSTLTLTG